MECGLSWCRRKNLADQAGIFLLELKFRGDGVWIVLSIGRRGFKLAKRKADSCLGGGDQARCPESQMLFVRGAPDEGAIWF